MSDNMVPTLTELTSKTSQVTDDTAYLMDASSSWATEGLGEDKDVLKLFDAVWASDRWLRFVDRRIEKRFAHDCYHPRRRFFIRAFLFWSMVGIVDLFAFGYYRRFADIILVPWIAVGARVANIAEFGIFAVLLRCRVVMPETAANMAVFLQPFFLTLANTYRIANFLGSDYYQERIAPNGQCVDDSFYTMSMIMPCIAPLAVNLRIAYSWIIVPWTLILYAGAASYGPLPLVTSMVNLAFMSFLGFFLLHGTYRVEKEMRWKWSLTLRLQVDNAMQRAQILRQRQWLVDVEERLNGFEGTTREEPSAMKGFQTSQAEDLGCREVPGPLDDSESAERLRGAKAPEESVPNALLAAAMAGRSANASRLRKMATLISEESYGIHEFFDDALATFPELELFFIAEGSTASSGNSAAVEYQRTMGALFAVYWSLRLDLDGKDGFCFGYDDSWTIVRLPVAMRRNDMKKRVKFHSEMEWDYLDGVVKSSLQGNVQRIEAMLVLTAIHDIMKVASLCPVVAERYAPYEGYAAGECINDHDLALAYVLEYYPHLLPSYSVLPPESQSVVLFTQGKMHFNHGWFVQAEAPPRAMLRKFKSVLAKARPEDLSFYFLHWLTDLSGAEGQPLGGAEKFVLFFPRAVLSAFLWSIPFLGQLTGRSETDVVEAYLHARFHMALPDMPDPRGDNSIAIMRLVVMAQNSGFMVPEAFSLLDPKMQHVLIQELSRTGFADQTFADSPQLGGPALFVYYGPALLQHCKTVQETVATLRVLAAVYHAGRILWPLEMDGSDAVVTLDGGALKANVAAVGSGQLSINGSVFALQRRSQVEGVVSLLSPGSVNLLVAAGRPFWLLDGEELVGDGVAHSGVHRALV